MKNKRDITFDIARSLCILWIVGVWHLKDYLNLDGVDGEMMFAGELVTTSVLGAFTFISGFFLKKYKIETVGDAMFFYKKRLLRFWILYLIATTSIYIASMVGGTPWFDSPASFVLSLLGLSVFFPPLPRTFWYISMLMFFYLCTPLMLFPRKRKARMVLYIIMEALFIILWLTGVTEDQCMLYFPMYALGMLVNGKQVNMVKSWKWGVVLCTPVLLGLSLLIRHHHLVFACWEILSLPLLIVLSDLLSKSKWVCSAGRIVSYASMNMYLFHRHFYLFAVIMLNLHSLHNIREAEIPAWVGVLVVLPVIILFSYFLQKVYDSIASRYL